MIIQKYFQRNLYKKKFPMIVKDTSINIGSSRGDTHLTKVGTNFFLMLTNNTNKF